MPTSANVDMTDLSSPPSATTPAHAALSAAPRVSSHLVGPSIAGLSTAVVPVSGISRVDPFSGPGLVAVRRSLASVPPASQMHSQFRGSVASAGSFSAGTVYGSMLDTTSLVRQLSVAKSQRDFARLQPFDITAELQKARDENDDHCSAIALLYGSFPESHSLFLALVSRLDAVTSQFFSSLYLCTSPNKLPMSKAFRFFLSPESLFVVGSSGGQGHKCCQYAVIFVLFSVVF